MLYMVRMKKLLVLFLSVVVMASCTQYAKVQKSMDYDYKYELAKAYYMEGEYSQASSLLEDVLAFMKGTIYVVDVLLQHEGLCDGFSLFYHLL